MPAPVKNVPSTVTVLPPAKGPELGRRAATAVWGAEIEVEAIWTAGLVQVRWTVSGLASPSVTVRTRWLVVPVVTEAGPAVLAAVKLSDEALVARWTGNFVLGGRWVTGTVRLAVWGDGVAPEAVTEVAKVPPRMVFVAAAPKTPVPGSVRLRPKLVRVNPLPGVTEDGREPVVWCL